MKATTFRTFGGSCLYFLFIAFSVSVHAADVDQFDSGISVETWSLEDGRDIPILAFDEVQAPAGFADDIRAEGMIKDRDGSLRFQLSHSGPMSRQVFANVRRVEQDNGLTRSIITNIADGDQMEYLTHTKVESRGGKPEDGGEGSLLTQLADMEDMNTECPYCVYVAGLLLSEAMCAATATLANYNCRLNCQNLGGVQSFDSGICGSLNSECVCWVEPKKIAEEF